MTAGRLSRLAVFLWRGCATAALALLVAGCAGLPQIDPGRAEALPASSELAGTPFFPQTEHHCGPAALATVMTAAGLDASPEQLAPLVYLPARQGSLPLDMLSGARRLGAAGMRLEPAYEALFEALAAGTPVVVLQNLSLQWYPMWHYAVVVGYDRPREEVILRSGTERRQVLPLATFGKTWDRSGRWAMMVVKPGEVPAGTTRDYYTDAAVALERVGRTGEARLAYAAGLERWPGDLTLGIGLGNTAFAQGDVAAAKTAFEAAAQAHPESDAALNNLAHVLAELGDLSGALEAARAAVALDGPNREVAEATLGAVLARTGTPDTPR